MAKKKKKFYPLKKNDDPRAIAIVVRRTGGKVQKVEDTKTGEVFDAVVCNE